MHVLDCEKIQVDPSCALFSASCISATYIVCEREQYDVAKIKNDIGNDNCNGNGTGNGNNEKNALLLRMSETVYIAFSNSNANRIKRNLAIFRHAREKKHKNILIVEPDSFVDEKIKEDFVRTRISDFIEEKTKNEEEFIYCFGGLPLLSIPNFWQNQYHYYSCHLTINACIYSKEYRNLLLKMDPDTMYSWDWINSLGHSYCEPLMYSFFQEEREKQENKENKEKENKENILLAVIKTFYSALVYLLRLDIAPKNGYCFMHQASKYLFWCLFFSLACFMYACVVVYYMMLWLYFIGKNVTFHFFLFVYHFFTRDNLV